MKEPAAQSGGPGSETAVGHTVAREKPPRPTPLQPIPDHIPHALRKHRRWVVWRYEWSEKKHKWDKPLYRADGRGLASSTNPDTWTPFDDALATYQRGEWDGIGFVIGEGIAGGDVDDCRNADTGELTEAARDILATADTYAEVSPSGTGLRYFAFGALPPRDRKRPPYEMYDGDGGRYFTVTGHHLDGTPATIEERTDQLAAIHARYLARPEAPQPTRQPREGPVVHQADRDVLEAAYAGRNGAKIKALYEGDMSDYINPETGKPDHSSADMALISHLSYYANYDRAQTDRLFRASGLMRGKWDEKRRGTTYGGMTLDRAFAGKQPGDGYQPPAPPEEDEDTQQDDAAGETPSQSGNGPPQGAAATPWPDPEPLPNETPRAPVLDTELLPAPIHAWTKDIAERASIGLDWLVPGALVSLAAVVGNRWRIRPKRHDPWTVIPNLYGALVIGPGLLKSHALQQTTEPLRKIEQRILERYEEEKLRGEAHGERLKAEQEAAADNMRKALRSKDTDTADECERRILELKQEAAATTAGPPRVTANDATVERLVEMLSDNERGLLLVRDELYGWIQSLHKQGRETDRAFFLEAHDGDKSYRQDRIRRGTVTADIVTLSILGGIQPTRLDALRRGAIEGDDADGLLQRFQILVWPDHLPPYRKVDRAPDPEVVGQVEAIFQRLYDLDPARYGHEKGPGVVQFQDDAQELFFTWLEALEHRIRDPDVQATPAWASYLGKTRSLMPSLALILHLVDFVTSRDGDLRVSLDAARRAAALTEYLEGHAAKLYAPELARRETAARRIVEKIAAGDIHDGVRIRDLYARGWSGLDRDQLEAGVTLLEELHWLRTEKVRTKGKGRPAVVLRLRPNIQDLADGAS